MGSNFNKVGTSRSDQRVNNTVYEHPVLVKQEFSSPKSGFTVIAKTEMRYVVTTSKLIDLSGVLVKGDDFLHSDSLHYDDDKDQQHYHFSYKTRASMIKDLRQHIPEIADKLEEMNFGKQG